ncbi:MAG: AAA family ATPase [Deltaproteobacteria bacterium]|nr:AAA family ATPase [Deltaproteobacteria bacterium]
MILTDKQQAAVDMVKASPISILTGGPGTGKTTACKAILAWAAEKRLAVSCCAPSGKAAKRMTEATGHQASTIHSLLGAQMFNGHFTYSYDEYHELECDLLIVDETSMVSNDLMADLLRAVNLNTRVLLVGDQDQLPSVGAGAVLRDLLTYDQIPHVELDLPQRNTGDIVAACHRIKRGRSYSFSDSIDLENGKNLLHFEIDDPEEILNAIVTIVADRLPLRGFDPVWDVQVISPTNEKGRLSCMDINLALQQRLNPNAQKITQEDKYSFFLNDKVIQTKNKRTDVSVMVQMPWDEAPYRETRPGYIVNGDIGRVVEANPEEKQLIINFFTPDRRVKIPSAAQNELLLSYCLTCHRMQGSEAPVVIIPVHKSNSFLMDRSWIYTAISRAQTICITIGQFSVIETAIDKKTANQRITRLPQRLQKTWNPNE